MTAGFRSFVSASRSMAQSVKEQKQLYRKRLKEAVGRLDARAIQQQSAQVAQKAIELREYQEAKSISIFLSMPRTEISTNDIVLHALKEGKRVFVPYIHADQNEPRSKIMQMLRLRDVQDLQSLEPDPWGIPSIPANTIEQRENALGGFGVFEQTRNDHSVVPELDLIFVPAMAFDQSKSRLGHGKGFYDKYLAQYEVQSRRANPPARGPFLVGLALKEQVLDAGEKLPTTAEDWKVDVVLQADSLK